MGIKAEAQEKEGEEGERDRPGDVMEGLRVVSLRDSERLEGMMKMTGKIDGIPRLKKEDLK